MRIYKLKGYYGSYTWEKTVYMSDDDERTPLQVAKSRLREEGHLTLGMASFGGKVVSTEYVPDED